MISSPGSSRPGRPASPRSCPPPSRRSGRAGSPRPMARVVGAQRLAQARQAERGGVARMPRLHRPVGGLHDEGRASANRLRRSRASPRRDRRAPGRPRGRSGSCGCRARAGTGDRRRPSPPAEGPDDPSVANSECYQQARAGGPSSAARPAGRRAPNARRAATGAARRQGLRARPPAWGRARRAPRPPPGGAGLGAAAARGFTRARAAAAPRRRSPPPARREPARGFHDVREDAPLGRGMGRSRRRHGRPGIEEGARRGLEGLLRLRGRLNPPRDRDGTAITGRATGFDDERTPHARVAHGQDNLDERGSSRAFAARSTAQTSWCRDEE